MSKRIYSADAWKELWIDSSIGYRDGQDVAYKPAVCKETIRKILNQSPCLFRKSLFCFRFQEWPFLESRRRLLAATLQWVEAETSPATTPRISPRIQEFIE